MIEEPFNTKENLESNNIIYKNETKSTMCWKMIIVLTVLIGLMTGLGIFVIFKSIEDFDEKKTEISCIYKITDNDRIIGEEDTYKIQLLNDNFQKDGSISIYINEKQIEFNTSYKFNKIDNYNIKYLINKEYIYMKNMFKDVTNLVSVEISSNYGKFNSSLSSAFLGCKNLKSFRSNINGMENMDISYMFSNCISLSSVIFENFATTVEDSNHMFDNCKSLISIELNSINTTNDKNMSYMFSNCTSIKQLNIDNYDIRTVKDLSYMFYNCYSLQELNKSPTLFQPDIHTNASITDMFYNCSRNVTPIWYHNITNNSKIL